MSPTLRYTRQWSPDDIVVSVGNMKIGNGHFLLAAGPCAAESPEQMGRIAAYMKDSPVRLLRGGAFKPRTSPYDFQGLGEAGLQLLRNTADELGIPMVTEVTDSQHLQTVAAVTDVIQIGSRNMSAYELLKAVGAMDKPVILKRGMSATVHEFLSAVEYIAQGGNHQIILCERGIRSFDPAFRNVLDLNAVIHLKQVSPFPVMVDPSHGSGRTDLVQPLSLAAVAAGADGVMAETHFQPEEALSDGSQSLNPTEFESWWKSVRNIAVNSGRTI